MNFVFSYWLEPFKRVSGAQHPPPPTQPSTHLGTRNHPQLQSEVLAKQRREQQEPLLSVGVGWRNQKKDNNLLLASKEGAFLKGAGEPLSWNWRGGCGVQVSDKQQYKTQREANSKSGSQGLREILPCFYQTHRSPHCPVCFDFLTMDDKRLFTCWKELAEWREDYCSAMITYNLNALWFVQSCNFTM